MCHHFHLIFQIFVMVPVALVGCKFLASWRKADQLIHFGCYSAAHGDWRQRWSCPFWTCCFLLRVSSHAIKRASHGGSKCEEETALNRTLVKINRKELIPSDGARSFRGVAVLLQGWLRLASGKKLENAGII